MELILCSFFTLTIENLDVQVKPGLPYLDIIRLLRDNSPLPIAAYQVLFWPILKVDQCSIISDPMNTDNLYTHNRSSYIIDKSDPNDVTCHQTLVQFFPKRIDWLFVCVVIIYLVFCDLSSLEI